jgi:hypothetical protein
MIKETVQLKAMLQLYIKFVLFVHLLYIYCTVTVQKWYSQRTDSIQTI